MRFHPSSQQQPAPSPPPSPCITSPTIQPTNQPTNQPPQCFMAATRLEDGQEAFLDYGLDFRAEAHNIPQWYHSAKSRGDTLALGASQPSPQDDVRTKDFVSREVLGEDVPSSKAEMSARDAARDQIQKELTAWREEFASTHGRPPNRHELQSDPVAKELFREFKRLSSLRWEEGS